ncbi:MAG: tyrosine-type recombinase/integrase [Clostridium sp.]|nr:tyrosine-type recombinase/integrase [Clostridium sp.]
MSVTYPIKNKKALKDFKDFYLKTKPNPRNYTMIIMGLNTAFRIGDLLALTWNDVYDEKKKTFRRHISIMEQKTGKERIVAINQTERNTLKDYYLFNTPAHMSDYLFQSRKHKGFPLSRYQAYRIVKEAAAGSGLHEHIGCHSLRKTFGYHAWKQGTQPAMLMDIYNHSSYQVTQRYLGIEQDERDNVYLHIQL